MKDYILDNYFEWLCYTVTGDINDTKYRKLLNLLHNTPFIFSIELDDNRAYDGVNLRWYYVNDGGDEKIMQWTETCTVLEMLIGLSMNIENIMENPDEDTCVGNWFWMMIKNLDLLTMTDVKFDKIEALDKINIFMNREYEPDGTGNIIRIEGSPDDLREVEIWNQMCWYLNSIIE